MLRAGWKLGKSIKYLMPTFKGLEKRRLHVYTLGYKNGNKVKSYRIQNNQLKDTLYFYTFRIV